jgi:hypothetical protein
VNSGTVGEAGRRDWSGAAWHAAAAGSDRRQDRRRHQPHLVTTQQQINEICTDRQNIRARARCSARLPRRAFNATIQAEVQNCGYGNARPRAPVSTGPTFAETLPPKTWLRCALTPPPAR